MLRCIRGHDEGQRDGDGRRRFTAQFKAKVATEALRGDRTVQAIAAKYEVHPNQVSGWKQQAQAGLEEVFAGATSRRQKDSLRSMTATRNMDATATVAYIGNHARRCS